MSYINVAVSSAMTSDSSQLNSFEWSFIEKFVKMLTSLDSRITCDADFSSRDKSSSLSGFTFTFNVAGLYNIVFTRSSTAFGQYTVSYQVNGKNSSAYNISSALNTNTPAFTFKLAAIISQDCIALWFGSYNQTIPSTYVSNVISLYTDKFSAIAYSTTSNKTALLNSFTSSDNTVYTIFNRLNYTCNGSSADLIRSKNFLCGGISSVTVSSLFDISSVQQDSIITIDGVNYYALDEHTLAKI